MGRGGCPWGGAGPSLRVESLFLSRRANRPVNDNGIDIGGGHYPARHCAYLHTGAFGCRDKWATWTLHIAHPYCPGLRLYQTSD